MPSAGQIRVFVGLIVGTWVLLAACGGRGVGPKPTPSAISTNPHYVAAAERVALVASCLQEKGFNVQVEQDLALHFQVPEEQQDALDRAETACWEEAEAKYPTPPPPSEEELWELYLKAAECLEALGYSISEPPTKESWMDAYPQEVIWYPYESVPNVSGDVWLQINRVCPQPAFR